MTSPGNRVLLALLFGVTSLGCATAGHPVGGPATGKSSALAIALEGEGSGSVRILLKSASPSPVRVCVAEVSVFVLSSNDTWTGPTSGTTDVCVKESPAWQPLQRGTPLIFHRDLPDGAGDRSAGIRVRGRLRVMVLISAETYDVRSSSLEAEILFKPLKPPRR